MKRVQSQPISISTRSHQQGEHPPPTDTHPRHGSTTTKKIELPHSQLFTDALRSEATPEDIEMLENILAQVPPDPDHIVEARSECAYEFLQSVLIPRVQEAEPLTAGELAKVDIEFKQHFRQEHPNDLVGEFNLLLGAADKLVTLLFHYRRTEQEASAEEQEAAELVRVAYGTLNKLLQEHSEELQAI